MTDDAAQPQKISDDPVTNGLAQRYPAEFEAALEALGYTGGLENSSEGEREAAGALVLKRHSGEVLNEAVNYQMSRSGFAADPAALPTGMWERLGRTGLTQHQMLDAAAKFYPELSPTEALKAWTAEAAKMKKRESEEQKPNQTFDRPF